MQEYRIELKHCYHCGKPIEYIGCDDPDKVRIFSDDICICPRPLSTMLFLANKLFPAVLEAKINKVLNCKGVFGDYLACSVLFDCGRFAYSDVDFYRKSCANIKSKARDSLFFKTKGAVRIGTEDCEMLKPISKMFAITQTDTPRHTDITLESVLELFTNLDECVEKYEKMAISGGDKFDGYFKFLPAYIYKQLTGKTEWRYRCC